MVCVNGVCVGVIGCIICDWQIVVNYIYLDVKVVGGVVVDILVGKILVNMFKYIFIIWIMYDVVLYWQIGGGVIYMLQCYVNVINMVQVGGYMCYDVMLVYIIKVYDICLNFYNFIDKMYYDVLI